MVILATAETRAQYAHLLREMHRQRRAVFIDRLGWALTATGGLEIDAYDGPEALYLLSVGNGGLAASARLLPTTRPHLMAAHFAHLCPDGVPRGPGIFEASRFCVDPAMTGRRERRAQLGLIDLRPFDLPIRRRVLC